jgi:hypothetical protein
MAPGAARRLIRARGTIGSSSPIRVRCLITVLGGGSAILLAGALATALTLFAEFAFGLEPMIHITPIGAAVALVNLISALGDFITAETAIFADAGSMLFATLFSGVAGAHHLRRRRVCFFLRPGCFCCSSSCHMISDYLTAKSLKL